MKKFVKKGGTFLSCTNESPLQDGNALFDMPEGGTRYRESPSGIVDSLPGLSDNPSAMPEKPSLPVGNESGTPNSLSLICGNPSGVPDAIPPTHIVFSDMLDAFSHY